MGNELLYSECKGQK